MAASPALVVSTEVYLYFVDRAVRGMAGIVAELGDDRCLVRAGIPGANSAFGLLTHCLGVVRYWGGELVAGREIVRDREAEFDATGTVAELLADVDRALAELRTDVAALQPNSPLHHEPAAWAEGPDRTLDRSGALLHLYEEVSQHHGQLQVLRDAVLAAGDDGFTPPIEWLRTKQGVKWHRPGPDLLPAWVADMDFPIAAPIRAALRSTIDRGDLGYPDWSVHPLAEPFAARMRERYQWSPNPDHVRGITDLIQALQIVTDLETRSGDGVLVQVPNYPPFLEAIPGMGRRTLAVPMIPDGARWVWDLEALSAQAAGARILLLVNPHNPTGRVFHRTELEAIAEIAELHDLIVISDEIHAELAHSPHRHIPFASLGPDSAARTVTITSATKAFNIAGLRTAVAHVGPDRLRRLWDAQPPDLYGATNVLGVAATLAAWQDGAGWQHRLSEQLRSNRDLVLDRVAELPGITMRAPDAGYLAWLDCTDAELPGDPAAWFRRSAGVELSGGAEFGGPAAAQHLRLNFATSTAVLDEILQRMHTARLRG